MAKRKRLSPAALMSDDLLESRTEAGRSNKLSRPPIAEISGAAATQAALEEVSQELQQARAEGRMVLSLPLDAVQANHLVRDRVVLAEDDMAALKDSLRARGQQAPIEVMDLGGERYGLISGWRRLTALRQLHAETGGHSDFACVKALLRRPEDLPAAYVAMVEENEIRADLSFFERARIVLQAVAGGVYPDTHTAVQSLFSAARAPKRSKILSFALLVEQLEPELRFPAAIPEKIGLALVAALQADSRFRQRLVEALRRADPQDAAAERRLLDQALSAQAGRLKAAATPPAGVVLKAGKGRITLTGADVDDALLADLRAWLAARSKGTD